MIERALADVRSKRYLMSARVHDVGTCIKCSSLGAGVRFSSARDSFRVLPTAASLPLSYKPRDSSATFSSSSSRTAWAVLAVGCS